MDFFFITFEDAPKLSCSQCLLGDHWPALSVILFLYSFIIEFKPIQIGATRFHLRPEISILCRLVWVLLILCVRGTQSLSIFDAYITCRESHCVGVFNYPRLFCTEIIEMWCFVCVHWKRWVLRVQLLKFAFLVSRWLSPLLLFLDTHEKMAVTTRRKELHDKVSFLDMTLEILNSYQ